LDTKGQFPKIKNKVGFAFHMQILGEEKVSFSENGTQHLAQELDGIFWENLFRLEVGEVTF
jgi:hypothetical protein